MAPSTTARHRRHKHRKHVKTTAAAPQVERKTSDSRRRSSSTTKPVTDALSALMLEFIELGDELLAFLDPDAIAALCETLRFNKWLCSVVEDDEHWHRLLKLHCGVEVMDKRPNDTSQQKRLEIAVRHTIPAFGCCAVTTYVSVYSQILHLTENVFVVNGDLGVIDRVGDHAIDCLAFPTSGTYRNPRVGVASRVHERAGSQLDAMLCVQTTVPSVRHVGSVLSTPGFESGVHLLVHCIGPVYAGYHPDESDALLYDTYRNALAVIHSDPMVTCAAFASISTGILRFPVKRAATIALRAVRDTMLERDFTTKIAFVCLDMAVLTAFQRAQREMLHDLRTATYHLASTV